MKRIFTLFITCAVSAVAALGQEKQNFETIASLSTLTNSCWRFSGATLSTTSPVAGISSLAINPAGGGTALLMTPFINLTASSTISFDYRLSKSLSSNASRQIVLRLLGIDDKYISLATLSLDNNANTSVSRFSGKIPAAGVRKLVIEVTATGDESTVIYLDNFTIDGSFVYSSPYGCKEMGDGTLSIHYLKTFQGSMTGDRVQLQWTVAENENNNFFELEKSTDGNEFKSIAVINASAKVAQETYSYSEQIQGKAFYRLKVVSRSNVRMYSHVLFFKSGTATSTELTLLQNPIQQSLRFGFVADEKATAILTVLNQFGVRVFQTSFQAGKGYNAITLPLDASLRKGLYFVDVATEGKHIAAKFMKD